MCVYLLITGQSDEEHLKTLDTVLARLHEAGVRLKLEKCAFMLSVVEYLGHRISADGLHPTLEKIKAIRNAPTPTNVSQLKSFLGILTYYCKFLPNMSTVLAPLYKLLQKNVPWTWGTEQQIAFDSAKSALTSDRLLVHYDPDKELILACDASPYGVGAVLSHRLPDGSDQPISFASRSLASAERKYSQLDKEALAIVFGIKRFHQYLFGRSFTILSDHKPLQHLFAETKGIPVLASARIQRWALILSAYNYSIEYKPGSTHSNADGLSRLPLPDTPTEVPVPTETILVMDMLNSLPVTAQHIKKWTDRDVILTKLHRFLIDGSPLPDDPEFRPYKQRHTELSIHDGCILWGTRVIVPPPGRSKTLEQLHVGHPGASRMKNLARCFVWWPGIDLEVDETVKNCDSCQRSRNSPAVAPLQPWEWPKRAWAHIHIDFVGPLLGYMFLVTVDAHSKWMDVKAMKSATSSSTIEHLRSLFATHGLPELLVSDNGTVFTSSEFKRFLQQNGIRHSTCAPYHPSTNGLAEHAVQTLVHLIIPQPMV